MKIAILVVSLVLALVFIKAGDAAPFDVGGLIPSTQEGWKQYVHIFKQFQYFVPNCDSLGKPQILLWPELLSKVLDMLPTTKA